MTIEQTFERIAVALERLANTAARQDGYYPVPTNAAPIALPVTLTTPAVLTAAATTAAPAVLTAPAAAEAPKRRGRPPNPAPAAAPAALAADPFDAPVPVATAPTPPAASASKTKADVRAALEGFRARLTANNKAIGDDDGTAQNKATTRVLAWLNEVAQTTSLASLPEAKYADVVTKAATAV